MYMYNFVALCCNSNEINDIFDSNVSDAVLCHAKQSQITRDSHVKIM